MSMLGLTDLVFIAPNPSSLHHHRQQQLISTENDNNNSNNNPLSVGFGIFPLLAATPCVQVVQNQSNEEAIEDSGKKKKKIEEDENGGEFRVCTDCGNRAKKDCVYRRCRSCCKGRGYDCTTHVRSTWVPALKRRERHVAVTGGVGGEAANKKTKNNNGCASGSDARFKESLPGHVRAPAVFKCHRVSTVGNGENEFAYLATVHISGHVFRGFLYDHGVDPKNTIMPSYASELQLGNNCISNGKNKECSSAIGVTTNEYDNLYSASAAS
ncbi:protein SHI RELATED SEQUENCE 6 isoform X2 [Arachis stenosperma]|uniref:protein SHI RELATED SEQUENCE 6 isoform X2 n=1 Tax=Arachis stenosperma TaxID=217475 RepID=UPI0025AB63D3|nr:protein SHI RELATED SEQUENCE 6 isoform X2 [Arachis stenosperma]